MQKFYEDTIVGTFFKSIFSTTFLPNYNPVAIGDKIVEGVYYVSRHYFIKCLETGIYEELQQTQKMGDIVYTSSGSYKILQIYKFGNYYPNVSKKELLNSNYYNEDTHRLLGQYLRCLKSLYNIDLMGMYNCFNSTYFNAYYTPDLQLELLNNEKNPYTVYCVPIKFNKQYSIQVTASSCLVMPVYNFKEVTETELQGKLVSPSKFDKPFTVEYTADTKEEMLNEKYFCLLIQIPKNSDSSLVVTEQNTNTNSQLGFFNSTEQYPFADKLIQYLVKNVITERETIPGNIKYLQTLLDMENITDFWDDTTKEKVHELFDDTQIFDVTGYVDSELERRLTYGY